MSARRAVVLGVGVDPIRRADLFEAVAALIDQGSATIAYANVHVLNTAVDDPPLRAFLNAANLTYCDGNGVRLGARLLGQTLPERMTGADWVWDLAAVAAARRWRLYWIGGHPGTAAAAAAALQARHPTLAIATDHGFHPRFGPADTQSIDRINAFAPHIVLVGMGTPAQERWVAARRPRIAAPVVWCVGAAADFISGRVPRPGPAWLIAHHEWLSRLLADPRRLWRRYLVGNAQFLVRIAQSRRTRAG